MSKKDIKSKDNALTPQEEKEKKVAMKLAKEQAKKEKVAKQINNKTAKAATASETLKLAEERKAAILVTVEAYAERILNAAIKKEEDAKAWATKYAELKKNADKKRKDAAAFKREAKAKVRLSMLELNKSIPKITKENDKNETKLDKEYMTKLKTKWKEFLKHKIDPWSDENKEAREKRRLINVDLREARKERRKQYKLKNAVIKTHRKESIQNGEYAAMKEETKRIKAMTPEERKSEYIRVSREAQKRWEESGMVPNSNQEKKDENKAKSIKRKLELADRRQRRMEKKIAVEISSKQKRDIDINRFIQSEDKRKARKQEKIAKVMTPAVRDEKGKVVETQSTNKKKVIKPVDKERAAKYMANNELEKYLVVTQTAGRDYESSGALICYPHVMKERIKEYFNRHMDPKLGNPDKFVGLFVKDPKDASKYIFEMINSKFMTIDGVSTSRTGENTAKMAA